VRNLFGSEKQNFHSPYVGRVIEFVGRATVVHLYETVCGNREISECAVLMLFAFTYSAFLSPPRHTQTPPGKKKQ
jgi:hypothetical protein